MALLLLLQLAPLLSIQLSVMLQPAHSHPLRTLIWSGCSLGQSLGVQLLTLLTLAQNFPGPEMHRFWQTEGLDRLEPQAASLNYAFSNLTILCHSRVTNLVLLQLLFCMYKKRKSPK